MQPGPVSSPKAAPQVPDEAELVRRVAEKDRRAFDALYRTYYRRLTRFLGQLTRRPHLTEEALNDTMLVVWKKAHTFDGSSRVSTWIFGIAYRKALKAVKRSSDPYDVDGCGETESATEGPETEAIRSESRAHVGRALAALPVEHRAVVELTYYHGYAYREIAGIVGCPVGTVKTRMFHARRKLKSLLWSEWGKPI